MGSNLTRSSNPPLVPKDLLGDIHELIEETRSAVARTVNIGLTMLYWRIGKRINEEILNGERADYGRQTLATLSQELTRDYGRGFNYSSLTRMVSFAQAFPGGRIVATLSRQLSWSHFKEIQITLDNAIRLGRLETTDRRDTASILRGLELVRESKLLNAAVVLYGKSDQLKTLYPQTSIRLARFRGKDRLADFADNRQYWGHAFALLRRAKSSLMDHVPIAGRVVPGKMIREDQPWYLPRATREALANALCHRDYTIPGAAVAVAMYDDHLEITNPSALHFGITPEKLTKPHESKPWNPIIANVFYRAGVIERWGTGTLNVIDWCAENGNPTPTWQEKAGSVYVTFLPAVLPDTPQVTGEVTDEVRRLLEVLGTNTMTRSRSQTALGLKGQAHFRDRYLQPAIVAGLIEMTIPDKPRSSKQRYRLTEKGRKVIPDSRFKTQD